MEHHHLLAASEQGGVVLDIGGDIGAAIVRAPTSVPGDEIEIRVHGTPWDGSHVAVRERRTPGGVALAALFFGLHRGCYEVRLREDESGSVTPLEVVGGTVTEVVLA